MRLSRFKNLRLPDWDFASEYLCSHDMLHTKRIIGAPCRCLVHLLSNRTGAVSTLLGKESEDFMAVCIG